MCLYTLEQKGVPKKCICVFMFACTFSVTLVNKKQNGLRIAQPEGEISCSLVWILPDFLSLTQHILALVFSYQIVIYRTKLNIWKDKGKYPLKMDKND